MSHAVGEDIGVDESKNEVDVDSLSLGILRTDFSSPDITKMKAQDGALWV